jgi:hypothetical protein
MGFPNTAYTKQTTGQKIGGDAMNNLHNYLKDIDISIGDPTNKPVINTPTTFRSGKLLVRSADNEHDLEIVVPNLTDDGAISLVPTGGVELGDEPLFRTAIQEVEGKVISAQSNTITDLDDENFKEDAQIDWDKIDKTGAGATTEAAGLMPVLSNVETQYLNGQGSFAAVDWGDLANVPSTFDPSEHTHDYDELDNIPDTLVETDKANTYDSDKMQTFSYDQLRLSNSAGTFFTIFRSAAAQDRVVTFPNGAGNVVLQSTNDTLSNKGINLSNNTVTDTSNTSGDLIKHNGTKFVRFARGSNGQVLKSGSGDLAWGSVDWTELTSVPSTFTPSAHNHDTDYADIDHDHDSDYAALSHNHSWADITSGSPPKLDDLSAPDDNTDLNASEEKHGLLPKLSGVGTQYLSGLGTWTTPAGGEGGGSTSLAGLTDDVDIDTPTDGQILEYSDSDNKWHNVENTGGSGAEELNDLTDVTVTTPTDGDILEYDTDGFVNVAHDHSGEFSALGHNHDGSYSALGHNHDSAYSAISHHHDSDYADIDHDHDEDYSAIGHNHDGTYATASHNHDATYAAISHNHSAANITSGTLAVARGGTGKTTFTQHALLKGGASNAYDEIAPGTDGKVLKMVSGTPAWADETGGGASDLDDLDDVTITTPSDDDILVYDSGDWVNVEPDTEKIIYAEADGDGDAVTFNIAHGMGSEPTYAFVSVMAPSIPYEWDKDGTNIIVTFDTAPADDTDNVKAMVRVIP